MKKVPAYSILSFLSVILFLLWLIALFHISNLWLGDSDNAFLVIAGNSVSRGNFFLNGYYLSALDSFFPADIYINALFVKILGFRPLVMHVSAVFIFVFFIAISFIFVNEGNKNKTARKISMIMLFIFLALPVGNFAFWTLQQSHLLTVVLSLLIFLLINKYLEASRPRSKLSYIILSIIGLTVATLNDNISFAICVAPIFLISAYFLFFVNNKSPDASSNQTFNRLQFAIIILSLLISYGLRELVLYEIGRRGGFNLVHSGLHIMFVPLADFQKNVYLFINGLLSLFGANFFGKKLFSLWTFIDIFKLTGVAIFLSGLIIFLKKIKRTDVKDREVFLDLLLFTGIILMSLAFLLSDVIVSGASSRYLAPVVIFGFIIAIRNFPYSKFTYNNYRETWFKLTAFMVIVIYAGAFISASGAIIPRNPASSLSKWLIGHKLTHGFAPYWDAGAITLASKGKVKVRQVELNNGIIPYKWLSRINWYEKPGFFVIYSKNFIYGGINRKSITRVLGKPSETYTEFFQGTLGEAYGRPAIRYGMPPYVIMVYKKGILAR